MAKNNFMAPIPGMSLTVEPGSRPWEQPPQYTTTKEVLEYYSKQLTNVDRMEQLADILRTGAPIDVLVESMITYGMMNGKHTIDAGMLVAPVLVELIITVAEMYGVEDYVVSADDRNKPPVFSEEEAREIVEKTEAKMAKLAEKKTGSKGLMAKGEE